MKLLPETAGLGSGAVPVRFLASPGRLLETQILRTHLRSRNLQLWGGTQEL